MKADWLRFHAKQALELSNEEPENASGGGQGWTQRPSYVVCGTIIVGDGDNVCDPFG